MLEDSVIAISRSVADERSRSSWEQMRQDLITSLETIKSPELSTILRDLDLVVAKLDLDDRARAKDLDERRQALTNALSSISPRERSELVGALITIYGKLGAQPAFMEGSDAALRLRLDFLKLSETYVDEMIAQSPESVPEIVGLVGGEAASIGWAYGTAVVAKGVLLEKVQEERVRLMEAGLIRSIGYCHRCKEIYWLDTSLACPVSPKHNLKEVVFMMLDDSAEVEQVLREKFKLGPKA